MAFEYSHLVSVFSEHHQHQNSLGLRDSSNGMFTVSEGGSSVVLRDTAPMTSGYK